ncbi:unnamed protein product [Cochlearia groenlandica]
MNTNIGIEPSPVNMPYLPDDVLLNCLSRVSRLYYPTLSLVSKRFRSLLASTELYKTRKLLGSTEACLYVSIMSPWSSKPRWFTLSLNPYPRLSTPPPCCFNPFRNLTNRTRTKGSSSGNINLISVPDNNYGTQREWNYTMVGSNIYMIMTDPQPSTRVFVIDCRSHTWREAPRMRVAKKDPRMCVVDGKIYVVERNLHCDIEVFDPRTQLWEHLPNPIRGEDLGFSLVYEGNLYLSYEDKIVVYKPKENKWDVVGKEHEMHLRMYSGSCVIDNIPYYLFPMSRTDEWFDSERGICKDLKGVVELPKLPKGNTGFASLANYGGNIVILWEEKLRSTKAKTRNIWCAEIMIERPHKQEVCGRLMWCNVVLTIPETCTPKKLFVATI